MKLISRSLLRKLILLLAPLAAVFLPSTMDHGLAQQQKKDETRSVMTWEHSDDGWRQRIEIRNRVEQLSELFDWSMLAQHYNEAHELALSRTTHRIGSVDVRMV